MGQNLQYRPVLAEFDTERFNKASPRYQLYIYLIFKEKLAGIEFYGAFESPTLHVWSKGDPLASQQLAQAFSCGARVFSFRQNFEPLGDYSAIFSSPLIASNAPGLLLDGLSEAQARVLQLRNPRRQHARWQLARFVLRAYPADFVPSANDPRRHRLCTADY
jgi:hypothetical protein